VGNNIEGARNMTEMVKAKLNNKFEMILPKHRADREEWYTESGWEKERLGSMHSNIGPGDVVYYIGAEEGEMPALCQIWGAEVVLFEPNPKVWSHMPAIWESNNLEKPLATVPCFASNVTDGKARVYHSEFPPEANAEIIAAHGFKELHTEAKLYGQIKIDDCVAQGIKPPTCLSIDVEGSEWQVLRGAEQTLRKHKPKIWLSGHPEFMIMNWNEYLADLRRWLIDFGYKETLLEYKHEAHLYYE
jgi:FkbM family methyltransferase